MSTATGSTSPSRLERRIGPFQATTFNMSQMCGIGPFITIPAMVIAFGGPQAILGWIAGAVLALCDGLIWAELGASMPGSGGTYVYLREAFQYRTGRLMPFLFIWTAILFIPLTMSTGILGFVDYLGYIIPGMSSLTQDLVGLVVIACITLLLWRNIGSLGRITVGLWGVMILTVLLVIIASLTHFHGGQVFHYPKGAFDIGHGGFWVSFAAGLTVGIYDYLGYNTTSYMGGEMKTPGKTIPRSVVYSVLAIMVIYLTLQIGMLGVVPWHEMTNTSSAAYSSLASVVLKTAWGDTIAKIVTALILITAFTSVFVGLLAGSRVPYDAAHDGVFFKQFARLHPTKHFPIAGVVTMCVFTAIGFIIGELTSITVLIQLLTTVMVLVQALGQAAALVVLRRRQPRLHRPYRMWLYPVPLVIACIGWIVIFVYSDKNAPTLHPIQLSLAWVAAGIVAFLIWARFERIWPFGPKEIHEQFLAPAEALESEGQPASADALAQHV